MRRTAPAVGINPSAKVTKPGTQRVSGGLPQATQVAFVMQAAGFSPAAARADPISRRDKSLGLLYEARLRGLADDVETCSGHAGGLRTASQGL